jgi:hypothetical protein
MLRSTRALEMPPWLPHSADTEVEIEEEEEEEE